MTTLSLVTLVCSISAQSPTGKLDQIVYDLGQKTIERVSASGAPTISVATPEIMQKDECRVETRIVPAFGVNPDTYYYNGHCKDYFLGLTIEDGASRKGFLMIKQRSDSSRKMLLLADCRAQTAR